MKKLIMTAALASVVCFANAQETMMSKKGTPILPEVGDWSIGFDAVPFLEYVGNMLNGNNFNTVSANYVQYQTIVGKYVKDANTVYRGKVRIGFGSHSIDNMVDDDLNTTTTPATVTDTWKRSGNDITLGAGLQKNRGKGRLHGFYGAEAFINFGSFKHTYDYANAFSATNTNPTSTDWNNQLSDSTYAPNNPGSRITEDKDGSKFGFGLRGFIGVEYFFAPKLSVSAEYGWGLAISSVGEGESTTEFWDASLTTPAVTSRSTKTGGNSTFGFDVDNAGGSIILSAYF